MYETEAMCYILLLFLLCGFIASSKIFNSVGPHFLVKVNLSRQFIVLTSHSILQLILKKEFLRTGMSWWWLNEKKWNSNRLRNPFPFETFPDFISYLEWKIRFFPFKITIKLYFFRSRSTTWEINMTWEGC